MPVIWSHTAPPDVTPSSPLSVYTSWKLDETTWDLVFPRVLLRGPLAVAQKIQIRLRFFKREWFLDTRLGVPYYERILIKNPDLTLVKHVIRKTVQSTPGVQKVTKLEASLQRDTRKLFASFDATLIDGATVLPFRDEPFIITV